VARLDGVRSPIQSLRSGDLVEAQILQLISDASCQDLEKILVRVGNYVWTYQTLVIRHVECCEKREDKEYAARDVPPFGRNR